MSKNFEKIKSYYEKDLWTITMVYNVVNKKNGITPQEYKIITGQDFI